MRDPIIITGAPRSGKTMIAGILDMCGVKSGHVNKRFENAKLHDLIFKPYLHSIHHDPEGMRSFPDAYDDNIIFPNFRDDIVDLMTDQGCEDNDKWMIKSSHPALFWPVMQEAFPNAKYIIIRRRIGDIATSCMKTAYMNAFDNREDWVHMCRMYELKFVEMINAGLNCKVIWPHRMAFGDYRQIYELLEWLGLEWQTEILNWIDPKFNKMRKRK